jgi:hypothetical protein
MRPIAQHLFDIVTQALRRHIRKQNIQQLVSRLFYDVERYPKHPGMTHCTHWRAACCSY